MLWPAVAVGGDEKLKIYDSRYYTIHTDLDADSAREADLRLTKMAEEYHQRTSDFAGVIREKFPVYLYRRAEDYLADGGLPGSAGVFLANESPGKLMILAGDIPTNITWHTVQHEGFHQFAHAVIGGELPPWLDEGLAEYFGEGIFTGDGFVMGVIPQWRLKRLKDSINGGKLKAIQSMMQMSPQQWQVDLTVSHYDEAWAMVHFLVHGENGKYRAGFGQCIREISAGQPFEKAWLDELGPMDGFEKKWKDFWLSQPENPTAILYTRATVAALTSFLARAESQGQTFDSFEQFTAADRAGKLKSSPVDWLPASLFSRAMEWSPGDRLSLKFEAGQPIISAAMNDGVQVVGSYSIRNGRVERVETKTIAAKR